MKGILLETLRWLIFDEILISLEYILQQVFDALIDSYTFPSLFHSLLGMHFVGCVQVWTGILRKCTVASSWKQIQVWKYNWNIFLPPTCQFQVVINQWFQVIHAAYIKAQAFLQIWVRHAYDSGFDSVRLKQQLRILEWWELSSISSA